MIELTLGGIVYLIGCILSYGRFTGAFWGLEELGLEMNGNTNITPWWKKGHLKTIGILTVLGSWAGFFGGCLNYFSVGKADKYFFKWSYRSLRVRAINLEFDRMVTSLKECL